jgi:hypothetical protein
MTSQHKAFAVGLLAGLLILWVWNRRTQGG